MMIKASQFVMLALVVVAVACASYALAAPSVSNELLSGGTPQMNTNIALVGGSEHALNQTYQGLAVVDPTGALNYATQDQDDIEEDPNDRFITSKKGLLRPILVNSPQSEWAEEVPVATFRKIDHEPEVLFRKKRCNNNDDDDGTARRARRARRTRRARAKRAQRRQAKAARRAAKSTSTTVTRTVIQNGQVVSTTSETQGAVKALPANQVLVGGQPLTTTVVQTVPQQHTVVQTVPQQQQVVVQEPAVVTATAPQVAIQ